jgi:enoyl-CoA hydratase/carnithine racemase
MTCYPRASEDDAVGAVVVPGGGKVFGAGMHRCKAL